MDSNTRIIIFYILIFAIFYGLAKSAMLVNYASGINLDILLLLMGIIMVGIIYLLRKYLLMNVDSFYFEVTPPKKCDGGSYMYSSNPEKQKFCSQFSEADIRDYSCSAGFDGRPVHFERSPDSDDDWKNPMCKNFSYDYPKPL